MYFRGLTWCVRGRPETLVDLLEEAFDASSPVLRHHVVLRRRRRLLVAHTSVSGSGAEDGRLADAHARTPVDADLHLPPNT